MVPARAACALLVRRVPPRTVLGRVSAGGDEPVVDVAGAVPDQLHACLDRTLPTERPPA